MANCNDLTDKMEKLIVEKKANGKNWNDLPDEMKELVIKEMTYDTRTRLKMCSKRDKHLVESTTFYYGLLRLIAKKEESNTRFVIDLRVSMFHHSLNFSLCMIARTSGLNAGQVVIWRNFLGADQHRKQIDCASGEDGEMMINRFFENIVFDRKLRFMATDVYWDYPGFLGGREFTFHLSKGAKITGNARNVGGWLRKIASVTSIVLGMEDYEEEDEKIEGLGNMPVIMNTRMLHIDHETDINDDQFVNFNSNKRSFARKSNITGKGVNQYIKKAIANDYPVGSYLEVTLNNIILQTWIDIINGLDFKLTYGEDYFDEEHHGQVIFEERRGVIEMNQGKQLEVHILASDNVVFVNIF